ncbi:NUDIX hydrolase [Patulibacter americanus]|uniref:NUDIX hydrolase n=1 Tax=Patulibacter americanus TaxID=588672 RepID=UPI0003B605B2|nr:NUDIX hydrolase N-terminal domain-containing protein [Patulibacter americanus]
MRDPEAPSTVGLIAAALRLRAIGQTGTAYSRDRFDLERFAEVSDLAERLLADVAAVPLAEVRSAFAFEEGYPTPKVDVRGVVFSDDGRLLFVREVSDGRWTLPGGWADTTDTPSEATEREVREEAGLEVRATKLLAVSDRAKHAHAPLPFRVYKLFFRCEGAGVPKPDGHEVDAAAYFAPDDLPPLSGSRVTSGQIARMFAHAADPSLPTDYD